MLSSQLLPHQRSSNEFVPRCESIGALLRARAGQAGDRELLVFPGADLSLTYRDCDAVASRVASEMARTGLRRGDRICLVFRNSPEFLALFFGALALGVIVVPINPDYSSQEIAFIVENSRSVAVYYDAQLAERMAPLAMSSGARLVAIKDMSECQAPSLLSAAPAVENSDVAVIIYTSGTTGKPKGVVLTHGNFLADAGAIAEWFSFGPSTRALGFLPLFHNNGIVVTLLSSLSAGGSVVVVETKAILRSFWALTARYQITFTSVMPSILAALLAMPAERKGDPLSGIISGGQLLPLQVRQSFQARFGIPIYEGFGQTEASSYACFNGSPAREGKEGSVGYPMDINDMAIMDPEDRPLGPGVEGEICIRGPNVANGYHDLPALDARRFRGGWLHTGDFGHRDEDGYYYFSGRHDDLIVKGGEKMYPAEVENVLASHPAVAECAVIGVPDPVLGEEICAFVKLKDGQACAEGELKEYASRQIAAFKRPRRIFMLNELTNLPEIPKGPTRKILYRELRAYYDENLLLLTRKPPG